MIECKNIEKYYKERYKKEKKKRKQTEVNMNKFKHEINILKTMVENKNKEIEKLNQYIEEKQLELDNLKKPKGYGCSLSGKKYETKVHDICKNSYVNNKQFNTQKEEELGGSSSNNDIKCNFIQEKDIDIEIKKYNTPDWMQCSIIYNNETQKWTPKKNSKLPIECREMFYSLLNNITIYDEIPLFMQKPITHEEWVKVKKETTKWDDKYIDIPSNSISKLYQYKGCNYIQISNGYGLYHLGEDICDFGVPIFDIEQQIRIRTKIHKKINKKGFCILSVTASCQPKNIKKLSPSKYSLDNKYKLPLSLIYK